MWTKAMCKELGRLAQGWDDENVTNKIESVDIQDILAIPKNKTVTYARIVVDYWPHKEVPNRVHITVGGNLIQY